MTEKIHLPGLNGIRAIAALVVLLFHIDQYMRLFGITPVGFHSTGMAGFGVILFFVLSGYLITHLLLLEKSKFGKVDLKKFYIRRILRIWPIYYFAIALGILIYVLMPLKLDFPQDKVALIFIMFSLLLSNVSYGLGWGITPITPLWSVGVEEQFYAFWPFILNLSKNILKNLVWVIVIYLTVKFAFRFLENGRGYEIIRLSCFDCMAIGGIGAFLVFTKNKLLAILCNPLAQAIAWMVLLGSIFYKPLHVASVIDSELHAFFYLIIIVNVSANPKSLVSLENAVMNFVGRISYGIYVYHLPVILLLSYLKDKLPLPELKNNLINYLIVVFIIVAVTLLISFLSFRYFESFFLKRKSKFSKIESMPG